VVLQENEPERWPDLSGLKLKWAGVGMARPEWSKAKMSWSNSGLTCVVLRKKLSYAKWPWKKERAFVEIVLSKNLTYGKWPEKESFLENSNEPTLAQARMGFCRIISSIILPFVNMVLG